MVKRQSIPATTQGSASVTGSGDATAATRAPSGSRAKRQRHGGLGRGLAALIPEAEDEREVLATRPLDVLFPARHDESGARERGGSARELLNPRPPRKSTKTAKAGKGGVEAGSPRARKGEPDRSAPVEDAETTKGSARVKTSTPTIVSRETSSSGDGEGVDKTVVKAEARGTSAKSGPAKVGAGAPNRKQGEEARKQRTAAGQSEDAAASDTEGTHGADAEGRAVEDLVAVPGATFAEIPIEWIIPNTRQPRQVFDEEELAELAASIREVGVLQPIVVRPIDAEVEPSEALREALEERPEARYELIMGERRLRASEAADLESIPAIVRRTDDADLLRDALLENLHRAQLNPLEEASAYQQLMADFGATQEELSKRIARSRPQIANTLRLLKLPPSVQRKVAAGVISAGHARALLALDTSEEMELLAGRIVSEGLSVRTTEELVRLGQTRRAQPRTKRASRSVSPLGESLVAQLSDAYDTRVTITEGRTKGRIVIEFAGHDDLERLAGLFGGSLSQS